MGKLIGTRRKLPAILAIGALLVIAAFAVPLLTHDRGTASAPTHPAPTPSTSPVPVPSGALALVDGSHLAAGVEVGYPHSAAGAISAAAEYIDALGSTLDPDYAASVMRVAGDPTNAALPSSLAASTVKLRADLQLPTDGPLDTPIAFRTVAQMYQVRAASTDAVMVLLLTDSTFTDAHGATAQTTGVFPVHMHWTDEDWKLEDIGDPGRDYSGLAATPETEAAAARGWLPLIATDGGAA